MLRAGDLDIHAAFAKGRRIRSRPGLRVCQETLDPSDWTVIDGIAVFTYASANLVVGSAQEVADEFLQNPICRKISFTGSTEVGKQLMRSAADQIKRLSLELGGHAPLIVFPDADPEAVAKAANEAYADLQPSMLKWRAAGLTLTGIAERLNSEGHTTRRGRPWNPVQVARVIQRGG